MQRSKSKVKVLAAFIACLFVYSFLFKGGAPSEDSGQDPLAKSDSFFGGRRPKTSNKKANYKDFTIFFDGLEKFNPDLPSFKGNYKTEKAKEAFAGEDNFFMSKEYLQNVLNIDDAAVAKMKGLHQAYVDEHISKLVHKYGIKSFGNIQPRDTAWSQSYTKSSGYVLIGGGQYSWMAFLVIKQIRRNGSKLPIELFIPGKDEYEEHFCEKVLPEYNARCNVFDDALAQNLRDRFSLGGFQYKMLALLSSKFENVLYLDSDGFPVRDLDYLFESQLYKENNMLIWPDAWARTTNPHYYDIAGIEVTEIKARFNAYDKKHNAQSMTLDQYNFGNSWYHTFHGTLPDPSSETGILMINKTSHFKTLLMCLYYNIYGPKYYYPLLTQGSAGEGDKETFIAAATVMNEPYYQTERGFKWCGYVRQDSQQFSAKALGHYDPVAAYNKDEAKIVFMHLSYPKFLPSWLTENNELVYKDTGDHIRMYGDVYNDAGYDFDVRILQHFVEALCPNYYDPDGRPIDGQPGISKASTYLGDHLIYLKEFSADNVGRCSNVFIPHLKWLKESTKF